MTAMRATAEANPDVSLNFAPPGLKQINEIYLAPIENVEDLLPYTADIENLANEAGHPNVCYEPWFLFPVARACATHQQLVFILIFDGRWEMRRRLLGLFVFQRNILHPLVPISCLRLWLDPFNFIISRDPLIRKGFERVCIDAVLDWFQQGEANVRLLTLHDLTGDTDVTRALESRLESETSLRHVHTTIASHLYRRQESAMAYLDGVMSQSGQKARRRDERRLADLGPVLYGDVEESRDGDFLIDEFLDLEARGWKGRKGVAAVSLGQGNVIKEVLQGAHRLNRLSLLTLRVSGKLIAARCTFLSPPGSFLFKLAYDENEIYAKRSPGILLEMEAIRRMHSDTDLLGRGISWMDTCAAPNSQIFPRTRSEILLRHRYDVTRARTGEALGLAFLPQARLLAAAARQKQRKWRNKLMQAVKSQRRTQ